MPVVDSDNGDLLDGSHPVIGQIINALCVKPYGLSAAIAATFSWANPYAERKAVKGRNLAVVGSRPVMGSCIVSRSIDPKDVVVMSLVAQRDYGGPNFGRRCVPEICTDTYPERCAWFEGALDDALHKVEALGMTTLALPYGIGCGLAKGDWKDYRAMIETVAGRHPAISVSIVRQ